MIGATIATMVFGPAGIAVARDCPLTDPTCLLDVVQDPVDDVRDIADETIRDAEDHVDGIVDTVDTTLDGLTRGIDQPPGDGGGGEGPGGSRRGWRSTTMDAALAHGSRHATGPVAGPSVLAREGGTTTLIGTATSRYVDTLTAHATGRRPSATSLREAATGIALSLLIALAAVVLFMPIQARLDRRDPRLALAPVTADVVTFV